jgi:gluconate 2-dehydrogenase gamma chain
MEAVQETLWPAGDGVPGARDVNATGVLDATLADPDFPPQRLVRVRAGLVEVEALARARGAADFASLDAAAREAVLVAWRERPAGPAWLRTVLAATLEAVLGDPVHGGNPGEVGWRWAGFTPGEPRPRARRR